jgi:hypothetical protein
MILVEGDILSRGGRSPVPRFPLSCLGGAWVQAGRGAGGVRLRACGGGWVGVCVRGRREGRGGKVYEGGQVERGEKGRI